MHNNCSDNTHKAHDSGHESDITERLRYIMQQKHLTQRKLAHMLRLDPSNLSKVMTGKLPFTEGLINRIVVDLGISKPWLRDGAGVPYDKPALTHEIAVSAESMQPVNNSPEGVPVYDIDVTAGCRNLEQIFSETHPIGMVNIPQLPPDSHLVKVRGDSMSPRINNGGYVAIRPIRDPRNIFWGQIYVVQLDEYRLIKYIRRHNDPDMVILHSDNPAYDDMDVDRRDIRALYIVEAILNYEVS
ncbi:XRE family transcriptional regulator [Duncaniella freteri]|uniref:XRE family transcriptional regulator n=2 Tax=Duncaniella freteri TaxID=2530391 RepID=UPI0013FC9A88|nr:S24 family peptidase [Duncaniella freteri]NBJ06307.1 hypothetical protein [Alistipes sp. Z76]NCE68396.1 hypothetical protein [Muribaculaceae bacterium M3]